MTRKMVVLGAGASGSTLAILLTLLAKKYSLDIEIELIERWRDILYGGGSEVVNIGHETGSEYCDPKHRKTGTQCIEGALASRLFFGTDFGAGICTKDNPMLFLVSKETLRKGREGGRFNTDDFTQNAAYMDKHFTQLAQDIITKRKLVDPKEIEALLGCMPGSFITPLSDKDGLSYSASEIAIGHRAKGDAVDISSYHKMIAQALKDLNITVRTNTEVTHIHREDGTYKLECKTGKQDVQILEYDDITIATAHNIPKIYDLIHRVDKNPLPNGTYYLNGMLYVTLPKTDNKELLDRIPGTCFTLQADEGCMLVCRKKPTATTDGLAAIYFPSEKGNQFARYTSFAGESSNTIPPEWQDIIEKGLQHVNPAKYKEHTDAILAQATKLYPFLDGYVTSEHIQSFPFRTVFNLGTEDSNQGLLRRVREMGVTHPITADNTIRTVHSPKWTNSLLSAFTAAAQIVEQHHKVKLPQTENGFGPMHLDMEQITGKLGINIQATKIPDSAIAHKGSSAQRQQQLSTSSVAEPVL